MTFPSAGVSRLLLAAPRIIAWMDFLARVRARGVMSQRITVYLSDRRVRRGEEC